ncbi:hypothetical protein CH63R_04128 [Colletotrichum higginsianum IMI 349063]|uniref:Cyclase n=1 Tax=Colletotrichum higginsianum (strain IMI 349063) TaxID=759273 RepID=A0A1B7YIM1_COLHI|nr:hypothetical protein CH63R_04128 [Colletotrichum higginsianum IMI 349063]OBR11832.1 hypothetical protein CH63R_04128 [Colletotrichum higginsianum IMI 349063]
MTTQPAPFFARRAFQHDLFRKHPRFWDGLRHFGYQKEERFYNGVSMDEVHAVDEAGRRSTVNGIQDQLFRSCSHLLVLFRSRPAWQKHGIIGRGILVDYHTWRLERQIPYDPFARDSIPVSDLKACLEAQGTEVKFGDILLTRTGFMTAHAGKSADDLETYRAAMPQTSGGVAQSEKTLRWVRDNSPAVGGDQPSFECWPHRDPEHWMHEVLLAGWGMPIGELFDLEALAERCRREGRWSFFVASKPCNIPGGVAR